MPNDKLKFLVVDDSDTILGIIKEILIEDNYLVDTAKTASKALEKIEQETFNVAIIDIRLPDMNGVELLKKIKEKNPKINCIIMTAYSEEQPQKALEMGADGYFIKPIDIEKLKELLKKPKK